MWRDIAIIVAAALVGCGALIAVFLWQAPQRSLGYRLGASPAPSEDRFLRALQGAVPVQFSAGNRVNLLLDGDKSFSAMLQAVDEARETITFENYIYWSGKVGHTFAERFAAKARDGVRIHLVLDWVGAWKMDRASLGMMREAGVEIRRYHPPRLGLIHQFNHRTHRRVLIVDGRVGFTGGVGFGDKWTGDGRSAGNWRDNHYRIEGPLVGALQSVFLDNWLKTSGDVLAEEAYFPALPPCGSHHAGIMAGSPGERISSGRLMILMFLKAARHSIYLEQAYFVPDRYLIDALAGAAERGVAVEIILPNEHVDYTIVRSASRALWGPLLKAGVKIFEYQPSALHVKTLVLDEQWVIAGSSNLDFRSLYRNDEDYLLVKDEAFTKQHLDCFSADKERSREITLEAWYDRPLSQKLKDRAASLVRSQL